MQAENPTWEDCFSAADPWINGEGACSWSFEKTFPIDVRFFVHQGDPSKERITRPNRHDFLELIYCFSGVADVEIENRPFQMQEGDLLVIGSNRRHRLLAKPTDEARLVTLFFLPELLHRADCCVEDLEYLSPFLVQDEDFPHLIPSEMGVSAQVFELMQRIQNELPPTSSRARLTIKTYLKMILISLVNHYAGNISTRESLKRRDRAVERLRPFFGYLENHFQEPVRVRDAARICAMSDSHFMYFLKQATGLPLRAFLNQFRVAKAKPLLASTKKSLAEISGELGFCSQSYFGRVFRQLVGMTPLAYRRRLALKANALEMQPQEPVPIDGHPQLDPDLAVFLNTAFGRIWGVL